MRRTVGGYALRVAFVVFAFGLGAIPAAAQTASFTTFRASPNPAAAGADIKLRAEVYGFNGAAPAGDVSFTDNNIEIATATLTPTGAGRLIAAGHTSTCAVVWESSVSCWGSNVVGELGVGAAMGSGQRVLVPESVALSGVIAIEGGFHFCALHTSGELKCWGFNSRGQLGNNSTTNADTPVTPNGLNTGVKSFAVGREHTCAIKTGGAVWCWGSNEYGQLGDGANATLGTSQDEPAAVLGFTKGFPMERARS